MSCFTLAAAGLNKREGERERERERESLPYACHKAWQAFDEKHALKALK
jgi:hypothetical protein